MPAGRPVSAWKPLRASQWDWPHARASSSSSWRGGKGGAAGEAERAGREGGREGGRERAGRSEATTTHQWHCASEPHVRWDDGASLSIEMALSALTMQRGEESGSMVPHLECLSPHVPQHADGITLRCGLATCSVLRTSHTVLLLRLPAPHHCVPSTPHHTTPSTMASNHPPWHNTIHCGITLCTMASHHPPHLAV